MHEAEFAKGSMPHAHHPTVLVIAVNQRAVIDSFPSHHFFIFPLGDLNEIGHVHDCM